MAFSRAFSSGELYLGPSPAIKDFPLPRDGSIESKQDLPVRNVLPRCFNMTDPRV
jgi:hypothetical protein